MASFVAEGAYDAGMQEQEAEISRKVPLAFAAPPTLHSPRGVVVGWLLEPAGALVQFAEPAKGTLSYVSPVAKALAGRKVGDLVTAGNSDAEIVAIE